MADSDDQLAESSQLWMTEQTTLAERAALVPDNGIIVEIGTAQGGSASIFHAATARRGVRIYSYDIAPSAEAYDRLARTNVAVIAKPSVEGAIEWSRTIGKPIDLLFLDGSHALQDIYEDFNSWVPYLKPGGEIIFHDYDSVERGGLAHLGVYLIMQAILRKGLVEEPVHKDRLLHGRIRDPQATRLYGKECYDVLLELGRRVVETRDADYSGWMVVGNGPFARLLGICLNLDRTMTLISPDHVIPSGHYLLLSRPLCPALDLLERHRIPRESIVAIDNLQACYIIARMLQVNRDRLLEIAVSRKEFFRWEEVLFMFDHAVGPMQFPDRLQECRSETDVARLSRIVALEQVRITILSRLLEGLIDWKP